LRKPKENCYLENSTHLIDHSAMSCSAIVANACVLADELLVGELHEMSVDELHDLGVETTGAVIQALVRDSVFLYLVDLPSLPRRLKALGLDERVYGFVQHHVEEFRAKSKSQPWVELCIGSSTTRIPLSVLESLNHRVYLPTTGTIVTLNPLLTHAYEILLLLARRDSNVLDSAENVENVVVYVRVE